MQTPSVQRVSIPVITQKAFERIVCTAVFQLIDVTVYAKPFDNTILTFDAFQLRERETYTVSKTYQSMSNLSWDLVGAVRIPVNMIGTGTTTCCPLMIKRCSTHSSCKATGALLGKSLV